MAAINKIQRRNIDQDSSWEQNRVKSNSPRCTKFGQPWPYSLDNYRGGQRVCLFCGWSMQVQKSPGQISEQKRFHKKNVAVLMWAHNHLNKTTLLFVGHSVYQVGLFWIIVGHSGLWLIIVGETSGLNLKMHVLVFEL